MGNQSSARLSGDEYQHLYSWYEILDLLRPDSPYEYAFVEHPEAGAADDITLHPFPGTDEPAQFKQIKWHTDQRSEYSFESLVEVKSGSRSLLGKLFGSWKSLKDSGPVEVWLVSNWSVDTTLGKLLSDDHSLDVSPMANARGPMREGRKIWMRELEASGDELVAFCRDLRIDHSFSSVSRLEEMVDDRMRSYQLQEGPGARHVAVGEIRTRIRKGGSARKITRAVLEEVLDSLRLHRDAPNTPEATLVVQGWDHVAIQGESVFELDWLSEFDRAGRRVPSMERWENHLLPQLQNMQKDIARTAGASYLDFRGKVPLTTALAVGFAFPQVAGYSFRVEQPTGNIISMWSSHEVESGAHFVVQEQFGSGQDIVVGLGVSGDGLIDIERLATDLAADGLIYAEPDQGPGQSSLNGAYDAVALAASAKELIRSAKSKYGAKRIHLVLYCPVTLALFIGQTLNAVGTIVTYERGSDGEYQPSVTLRTG